MIKHIQLQADSMAKRGWKLSAVTVATLYDGRGMLKLWWQNDRPSSARPNMEVIVKTTSPRCESSRMLDQSEPAAVERAVLAAAARCGAKTVSRIERSPLALHADPYAPGTGLVAAFADTNSAETPWVCRENFPEDVQMLIERAADEGWIMWLFDPACPPTRAGDDPIWNPAARLPRHLRLAPFADHDHHHVYYLGWNAVRRASGTVTQPGSGSSRRHALNTHAPLH
jgi:hypothetical protein